jgi:alpha-glucoside transport system substrate-binding protein
MAGPVVRMRFAARALSLGAIALLAACTSGGTSGSSGGSASGDLTVWTAWGGQELKAFQDVLKPFEKDNPSIKVHLLTIRDSDTQLSTNIQAGTSLPDIAPGPATPDLLQSWVSKGVMKPIENAFGSNFQSAYMANTYKALTTPPSGQSTDLYIGVVGGKHYEEMVKTQVKGLFWYNTNVFKGTPPSTLDQLLAINPSQYGAQSLLCTGVESGSASGWPASDMIDNILMRTMSASDYTSWIQGKIKFTDPRIKNGYQILLQEMAKSYGGTNTILTTNFGKAGDPMFKSPPGCLFIEQATFITSFFQQDNPSLKASDYAFFAHPSVDAQYDGNVNGFYDQFAMYNDTPAARKLMQYMASASAQQIWANDGGTLAARTDITYTDPVFKAAADVAKNAKNLLVTAGDFMPTDMQAAFWKSLLNVTRNPSSLDSELSRLDQVQAAAYQSG